MITETLLRRCLPWVRRQSPNPAVVPFDARVEQARLSELVLRRAAELLARPVEGRAAVEGQVQLFCDDLTRGSEHLRLCWTWFGDADTEIIVPQIVAGRAAGYAQQLRIERGPLARRGPAFRALAGRRADPFNVSVDSLYPPWREAARSHHVRSALALPLAARDDARRGIFLLYADVPDYFAEVGVGLFEAVGQLIASVLSQASLNEQLARQAHTDALTGLHNRAAAQAALTALRQDPGQPMCLLLLDLDHFKAVNDEHGHAVGDAVLVSSAGRLRAALRRRDGLARWGGEEFVAWLPGTAVADGLMVAEKLRAAIAARPHALDGGGEISVSTSVGIVERRPGETLASVLARADRAMYAAKAAGRDRVSIG